VPSRWKFHALLLLGVAVAAGLISAGPPLGVD
jgi:hypothetical protein